MKEESTDLPQPGLDEESPDKKDGDHPTDGPGGVAIDEPTQPSLDPDEESSDSSDGSDGAGHS